MCKAPLPCCYHSALNLLFVDCPSHLSLCLVQQMEEYRGARDVESMKEFVVTMKAKAAVAVDVGNEGVPPEHETERQQQQLKETEDDEDASVAPVKVVLCSFSC